MYCITELMASGVKLKTRIKDGMCSMTDSPLTRSWNTIYDLSQMHFAQMTHAPKIATQKKQPISILCDKKYLYQTALTLLNPDIVHKIMQK